MFYSFKSRVSLFSERHENCTLSDFSVVFVSSCLFLQRFCVIVNIVRKCQFSSVPLKLTVYLQCMEIMK